MNAITKDAYEGDLVSRLRNWRGLHLAHGGELFEEAAGEIERLRLTAEERWAIERAIGSLVGVVDTGADSTDEDAVAACVMRSLLDRCAIGHQ